MSKKVITVILVGIVGLIIIFLLGYYFPESEKTGPELAKKNERILIKKVEIVPNKFMDIDSVSMKITMDKPIQCEEHTTSVLYNNFYGSGYLSLLLPLAHPNKVFCVKTENLITFWDQDDKKCILRCVIKLEPVQ